MGSQVIPGRMGWAVGSIITGLLTGGQGGPEIVIASLRWHDPGQVMRVVPEGISAVRPP
jgi:hypothetical protein